MKNIEEEIADGIFILTDSGSYVFDTNPQVLLGMSSIQAFEAGYLDRTEFGKQSHLKRYVDLCNAVGRTPTLPA